MAAVSCCVALMNVVGRLVPFHRTNEQGKKLLPVTLSVRAAVPAVALAGEKELTAGTGSEAGAVTEKLKVFEMAEPLVTVTRSVPWNAASADVISAVSCAALTKVVARGEPFQLTTELLTKFEPFTVNVRPATLQDAVEDPETEVIAGGEIVNGDPLEVPPPGKGLNTLI